MRSWVPRPPSAGLKERLFGTAWPARETAGAAAISGKTSAWGLFPPLWQWLAPGLALFIATATFPGHNPSNLTQLIASPATNLMAALALGEADLPSYCTAEEHSGRNALQVATFEWTNHGRSLTTAGSIWDYRATNR